MRNGYLRYRRPLILGAFLVLLLSVPLLAGRGSTFSGCEEDCQKCHTITTDEITLMLKKLQASDAKILKTQMSPVKGLWEVAIEIQGQRDVLYVDFSRKFLVRGAILEVDAAINRTKERVDELNKDRRINPASIPLKDALVLGSNTAQKKVIVFTDPD